MDCLRRERGYTKTTRIITIVSLAIVMSSILSSGGNIDLNITPAKKEPSAHKRLQVKKIMSLRNSKIPNEEVKRYLQNYNPSPDTSFREGACSNTRKREVENWVRPKRIRDQYECSDTVGCCIYEFPRNRNGSDRNVIDYYYVRVNGNKFDSLIFMPQNWECPDHNLFFVFIGDSLWNYQGNYNYIGNNRGAAAKSFTLKPYFRDKYEKRYTKYTPTVSTNDSSSLLIYSKAGFEIKYETLSASTPTTSEKKLIFEKLFDGVPDVSCFTKIRLEKLAAVGGVSRFIGLISIENSSMNSWYIADIEKNQCAITVLEASTELKDPGFYCAYSLGGDNLPDIYVWVYAERVPMKSIYYKSNNRWIEATIQYEYQGDCFSEGD